jgi:TetR/AcrR family transcriptional regulator, fatty acid metabolism regulator protein
MLTNIGNKMTRELTKRQEEIINCAVRLISEEGIQNLTIRRLAAAVGVTEPALYRHFTNKFDILDTLLDCFEDTSGEVLSQLEDEKITPLEKIQLFILDRIGRMSENPHLARVMFSEEIFQDDERLSKKVLKIMHSHGAKLRMIVQEGQQKGEIRQDIEPIVMFRLIFGPVRLLIKQWCLSRFAFDLKVEGSKLWDGMSRMIVK